MGLAHEKGVRSSRYLPSHQANGAKERSEPDSGAIHAEIEVFGTTAARLNLAPWPRPPALLGGGLFFLFSRRGLSGRLIN